MALPIDIILNETVQVIEQYAGQNPEVTSRLKNILKTVRDVRETIQEVGRTLAPVEAVPPGVHVDSRPMLANRRILVIDAEEKIRTSAHDMLDRYGCVVETAHAGREALMMVRNIDDGQEYDAIISDISLPDMGRESVGLWHRSRRFLPEFMSTRDPCWPTEEFW